MRSPETVTPDAKPSAPPADGACVLLVVPPCESFRDLVGRVERMIRADGGHLLRVGSEEDIAGFDDGNHQPAVLVFEDAHLALDLSGKLPWMRAVIALPMPEDALSGASKRFGIDKNGVASWVARWRCSAMEIRQSSRAADILTLRPRDAVETLEAIADWLGIASPLNLADEAAGVGEDWVTNWLTRTREPSIREPRTASRERVRVAQATLAAYDRDLDGGRVEFEWPYGAFFCPDFEGDLARPTLDLTGRARALYYGPYFWLPPGEWQVSARLTVAQLASAVQFRLETEAGGAHLYSDVRLAVDGAYDISFSLNMDTSTLVDFRLWLLAPCFSGVLTFHHLHVQRQRDILPDT